MTKSEIARAKLERVNREGLADPLAAMRHGLHTRGWMPCRRCILRDQCERAGDDQATCVIEQEYYAERLRVLGGLPHIDPETDLPAIMQAIWLEIRAARGRRWLGGVGEFLDEPLGEGILAYQPAATEVRRLQQAALKALAALGATPVARRKLEDTGESGAGAEIAEILRILDERDQERRADAQDAEFEAEDEEQGGRA